MARQTYELSEAAMRRISDTLDMVDGAPNLADVHRAFDAENVHFGEYGYGRQISRLARWAQDERPWLATRLADIYAHEFYRLDRARRHLGSALAMFDITHDHDDDGGAE